VTSIEGHRAYASRKAQELMDAGDMAGASLCLERVLRTNPDAHTHLRLGICYIALHRDAEALEQGMRSLALAQFAGDEHAAEAALAWLESIDPGLRPPFEDALFLNHRPESADTLYEELVRLCEVSKNADRGAAGPAPD
jgi:tetratricopeptide (TPR) repeat protein